MSLHKLTHEKAVVLDKVLSFLLESGKSGFDEQAYGEFLLNDYFNGITHSIKAIDSDFYITDTLIKDEVSPPYKKSQGIVQTTEYTLSFL